MSLLLASSAIRLGAPSLGQEEILDTYFLSSWPIYFVFFYADNSTNNHNKKALCQKQDKYCEQNENGGEEEEAEAETSLIERVSHEHTSHSRAPKRQMAKWGKQVETPLKDKKKNNN